MNRQQPLKQMAYLGLLVMLLAGCAGGHDEPAAPPTAPAANLPRLDGKRALFVLYDRFMDTEYSIPRRILEDLGATVTVASSSPDALLGSAGNKVRPQVLLPDVATANYDAIVFVGGQNVESGNPDAHRVAQEAAAAGKVLAAICAARATLIRAGVVEGRQPASSGGSQETQQAGSNTSRLSIQDGGLVIVARGPLESREFGEAIAMAMGE